MEKHTIYGLLIIVTLVFCLSVAPSVKAASDEDAIMQLLSDYFKGWNANNNKIMASIHWNSPDMSFFGPGAGTAFLTKGWEETAKRLKSTFESPVGTYSYSYHDPEILMIEKNVAIVTMYSIWNITDQNTKEQQIMQIRGTQVVKKINGKWQIVHVHWSTIPTE